MYQGHLEHGLLWLPTEILLAPGVYMEVLADTDKARIVLSLFWILRINGDKLYQVCTLRCCNSCYARVITSRYELCCTSRVIEGAQFYAF